MNRTIRGTQIERATDLVCELLGGGPMPLADVKAEARTRGLRIGNTAWDQARRRLELESFRIGRRWYWQLPTTAFDISDVEAWLDSPEGRFEAYLLAEVARQP
jgi:hypothetical protein